MEVARALMFTPSVPKYFWRDELTEVHLMKKSLPRVLGFLSLDFHIRSWFDLPLQVFGCSSLYITMKELKGILIQEPLQFFYWIFYY